MPKKVPNAPPKSISALQEKALELIGSKSDGLYQSDLRKQLGIESAKCSKIVFGLERSGLIKREPADYARRRTYLIRLSSASLPKAPLLCNIDADRDIDTNRNINTYRNIDTYLTEFYLLYLIRGSTSA